MNSGQHGRLSARADTTRGGSMFRRPNRQGITKSPQTSVGSEADQLTREHLSVKPSSKEHESLDPTEKMHADQVLPGQAPTADKDTFMTPISEKNQGKIEAAHARLQISLQQLQGRNTEKKDDLSLSNSKDSMDTEVSASATTPRVQDDSIDEVPSIQEEPGPFNSTLSHPLIHMVETPDDHEEQSSDSVGEPSKFHLSSRSPEKSDDSFHNEDPFIDRIKCLEQNVQQARSNKQGSRNESDKNTYTQVELVYQMQIANLDQQRSAWIRQSSRSIETSVIQVLLSMWALHHLTLYTIDLKIHHFAIQNMISLLSYLEDTLSSEILDAISGYCTEDIKEKLQEKRKNLRLPNKEDIISAKEYQSIAGNILEQLCEGLKVGKCLMNSDSESGPLFSSLKTTNRAIQDFCASPGYDVVMKLSVLITDSFSCEKTAELLNLCSLESCPWSKRVERCVPLSEKYQNLGRVLGFETEVVQWKEYSHLLSEVYRIIAVV